MKRIIGVFAALALGLAIAACGGSDDDNGAGGSGGNGAGGTGGNGAGGTGGGGDECATIEIDATLAGSCNQGAAGCWESRGSLAVDSVAEIQAGCETAQGTWSDSPCAVPAGGSCAQSLIDGWTTIFTWTSFDEAMVRSTCDNMPCATYVAP
jgi:hypothetical protein